MTVAALSGSPQDIRRRHRVLHRQIDADAADGRHRVRGIADAQQPRPMPALEPVDRHGQKLDLIPVLELVDAVREHGQTCATV